MNESSPRPEDADEVLVHFLAELEHAAEPEQVVAAFCAGYPDRARELRELVELRHILDRSAADVDPEIPARLGDFRIVRQIDHGGMGAVCEAIQEPLDRRVVVKIIRHGRTSPESRERFLREQRVLAKLHQTHIVPVFAAGEEGLIQYFAMPFIDGVNLQRLIGTARERGSSHPNDRMPLLAELVETAKAVGTGTVRERRSTGTASRERAVAVDDPTVKHAAPLKLPGTQPVASEPLPRPLTLSVDYFRSVALIMADIAESVHHAHEHGFVHRDLKPSNIMVDPAGQGWLIDFGLAGHVNGHDTPVSGDAAEGCQGHRLETVGSLGTPGYMAPEQEAAQETGVWTDVWGLGVTLYELTTLHRANPRNRPAGSADRIRSAGHTPPRRLITNVPRDLEAICEKALRVDPDRRYASAQAVADDLNRWLQGEPTVARPARAPRRVLMWARRNKAWAAALATLAMTVVTIALATVVVQHAAANTARREAEAAKRGQLTLRAQTLVTRHETTGWSDEAWELCRRAVAIEQDEDVRDLAAATLVGLDASRCKRFLGIHSTAILFDTQSQRLLMNTDDGQAGLWDVTTDELRELKSAGNGPVAFADDVPRQLVVADDHASLAWLDLTTHSEILQFSVPQELMPAEIVRTCVTPDSSTVAAVVHPSERNLQVVVWDGRSGQLLHGFSAATDSFALSPDGSLLATADQNGNIAVRSIQDGADLCTLRGTGHPVAALAFGRDSRQLGAQGVEAARCGWLLAAGHVGGPVTIWDVQRTLPLSYCRGGWYSISSLAFSPDGASLASVDHWKVRLWDVMTGRPLLTLGTGANAACLTFSPDGTKLAATSTDLGPGVSVWDLEWQRGVQTLRGLASPVAYVCLAPDGSLLAANTHDWQVGIWDVRTGMLRHVLAVPKGVTADNAAMAFSPDASRFAFSAGNQVTLWRIDSGEKVHSWQLPDGLVDLLAFPDPEHLLSFRTETRSGERKPHGGTPYQEDPRVFRIRGLLSETPTVPIAEITDFPRLIYSAACAPDGSHVVVDGLGGPSGDQRQLKIFSVTGDEVCEIPTTRYFPYEDGWLIVDPTGTRLAALTENGSVATLLEFPTGKYVGRLDSQPTCLSPQAALWVYIGTPDDPRCGLWLFRRDEAPRLALLGLGLDSQVTRATFSRDGTLVAWGDADGTVSVCSIPTVQRRLAELGMGW